VSAGRPSAEALAALVAASPYWRSLGLRPGPDGTVVLPADRRHLGDERSGSIHGGILAAFVEAAGVLHLRATGSPDASTIEATADFLRPAAIADTTATVTEVRRGRTVAHLRIELWQGDPDRPVVVAHGSWLLGAGT
jgi:uncharacterized protein (TIGR00369 family)